MPATAVPGQRVTLEYEKNGVRLRLGFFSFLGCEGCMVTFTEILNSKYAQWKDRIDIRYCRLLQEDNDPTNLDVAFVEGAIGSEAEAGRLRAIRANCKKLVAIGSCAICARPADQRNYFDPARMEEIRPVLERFGLNDKVVPLKSVVKVDAEIAGCPIIESEFIKFVDSAVKEMASAPGGPEG